MRSFPSKCSLACHAVKGWVWGKTCVCMCVSAPDICIYLYICILFVQINVSSDVEYRRETPRRSWYNSKASEIFLSKTWNSDFWLIVKMIWRKIVAHQGAKICIYLLMLLLYYTVYCINNWNDSNNNLGAIPRLCAPYFIDTHFSEVRRTTVILYFRNTQWKMKKWKFFFQMDKISF